MADAYSQFQGIENKPLIRPYYTARNDDASSDDDDDPPCDIV